MIPLGRTFEERARLEGEMRDRVESIQGILNEVASIQDAIIAGSSEIKRELEKGRKRLVKSGDRELWYSNNWAATRLGELRALHNDAVQRIQGALQGHHLREYHRENDQRFAEIIRFWEAYAREVDEAIADVVDANAPVEMIELHRNSTLTDMI